MSAHTSLVRAQRVSFAYSDAVPVLTDAEFQLAPGWTGLIGSNGAGKSTLLRLLAGELVPTGGSLRLPDGARVEVCPQSVERITPGISAFGESTEALARRLHGQLQLDPWALERWPTLSPGERKRWQIGAALAAEPEVLLLDEPTNHLDAEGREWLLGALARYRGIGVVVSHDRAVLERLTTHTLRVHRGEVRLYRGAYAQARQAWEAELQERLDARSRAQQEARTMARQLDQQRREMQAASHQKSARVRMRNKNDSDARSLLAFGRAEFAEKSLGQRVGSTRRALEGAQERVEELEVEKTLGRTLFVGYERPPNPWLFVLDSPGLEAGGVQLTPPLQLSVGRESRIHLCGPNGAGKSTLVRALLANARVPLERVLVLPQDLSDEEAARALGEVRALAPEERGRVMQLVAALGVDPERLLASESPSPGEARKLLIALGLARHAWALVLDEPTNHLDLPAIERLEEALRAYPGALLLVSHDEAFAQACCETRWRLSAAGVEVSSV